MDKRITSDTDIQFYKNDFNFKVYAGPGAGKTYFLIKNIISTIKNSKKLRSLDRKILCITYTNVAVDEIKQRLGEYKQYVEICTIHSFLYEYVINPYQQQLKYLIKQIYGISIPRSMKFHPRAEGFGLLQKLKRSEFIELLVEKYNIKQASSLTKKQLSEYIIDLKSINTFPFNQENVAPGIVNKQGLSKEDALKIKGAIWQKEGILDFDEILYFSYSLLKQFKFIKYDIQYHFPYIFIDEYQDTNPIQNAMIGMITENQNVSIGVVGDVAQSIYAFQGANYKEFLGFKPDTKNFKKFIIEGNRRSNQHIINFLNYIRQGDADLNKQTCLSEHVENNKVKFIITKQEYVDVIGQIDQNAKVLCRKWTDVFNYIKNINEDQNWFLQKIHSFYKYQLERDIIKDFENDDIPWISQVNLLVHIKESVASGNFPLILKELGKLFKISLFDKNAQKHNTREFEELKNFIEIFNSFDEDTTYYDMIKTINDSLKNTHLELITEFELPTNNDPSYYPKLHPFLYKLNLKALRIMVNEIFTPNSKYVTIHRTKGKEYNSVFVNLDPAGVETKLGTIVDILTNPKIIDDELYLETEFVRLAYVASSRAISNLYIHIPADDETLENMFKNLDTYIKHQNIEKFYEIIYLDE